MRKEIAKRIIIVNIISIFWLMFLFSNIYKLLPNFLTAAIFPVNESLFEHMKLMFITPVIVGIVVFIILKIRKIKINNYFFGLLTSTIINIILFFLVYIPFYSHLGENLFWTMGLYLIILIITEYLYFLIMSKLENIIVLNILSILVIMIVWITFVYFTFNPIISDYFFDSIEEKYGIDIYL